MIPTRDKTVVRRIVFVSSAHEFWGAERSMLLLATGLRGLGDEVSVLCAPGSSVEWAAKAEGLPVLKLPASSHGRLGDSKTSLLRKLLLLGLQARSVLCSVRALRHAFAEFDVAVSFSQERHVDCGLAGLASRTRVVLDVHDIPSSVLGQGLIRVISRCTRAVAISDFVASKCRLPRETPIVPRPVRLSDVSVDDRAESGYQSDFIVGVFGQVTDAKRLDLAASAVEQLVRRGLRCRLRVVGAPQGSELGSARDEAAQEATRILASARQVLGERLEVLPHTDAPLDEMGNCHVVINPNPVEPLGRTLIEAQAMGVPVVAMEGSGSAETLLDGITGLVARPPTAAGLAGALEKLYQDGGQRRLVGRAGAEWARSQFSEDRITHLYRAALKA